ncbi:histidinol-phosphatase HisJ [Neobacillus terrae]|uniref:histidinol-phosphatase HisJ n=1 Tax=Neobacillus terrae TaxID=3034837 RepID=UPI001408C9CF|nr:histidinol-phosphatase HisJ [Neobacillus terrae]NHM30612.1 histidinol-phosphatase HisJ [Neobacillus terrae]
MVKKDGHIHTPYCPHGTKDSFEEYIEKAISMGFEEISFTEHAPLPYGFIDTVPEKDSAMDIKDLEGYFEDIEKLKERYSGKIRINCGLEVDFIEGFEEETKSLLNYAGNGIDDAVLSVHFLKHGKDYQCLDYSPALFESMIREHGSIDLLYKNYFRTVLASVMADIGPFKPKRLGHITLIRKFHKKFPQSEQYRNEIFAILLAMKKHNCELDYNGAGTAKPLCREPYPPEWIVREALRLNIPLVYGSDAHQSKDLGQGLEEMIAPFS